MLTDLIVILLGVVMVNSFVLPGCPALFAPAGRLGPDTALPRLAVVTPLVVGPASALAWSVRQAWLQPLQLAALQPLVIIALTALVVQLAGRVHDLAWRPVRPLPRALLTFNAVAAGLALEATMAPAGWRAALALGTGIGLALGTLNLCFAGLRERFEGADLPRPWRGVGIALVSAGILSLGLGGFAGIWRG